MQVDVTTVWFNTDSIIGCPEYTAPSVIIESLFHAERVPGIGPWMFGSSCNGLHSRQTSRIILTPKMSHSVNSNIGGHKKLEPAVLFWVDFAQL